MKRQLALALATLLLAGCGGGGGSTPGTPAAPAQSKTANGSVVISIPTGPGSGTSAKVRYPQFVSPNASSVELSVNGGPDTVFDVSTSSSLCTTVSGARNCTLSFGAPVGSDTFAFLIFAGVAGTGAQLASASTTQTIAAGTAFNFTVALNAAVGTIMVGFTPTSGGGTCPGGPLNFNGFNEGCAGSGPLSITVDDPSGAQITGSAPFATPLHLTTNEPTITVSPATMTAPNQTVTISYAGVPWQSITNIFSVNVTAGGQTGSLTIFTEQSNLYVANANAQPFASTLTGGGNVAVYRFGASGSTAPVRVITSVQTPVAVQVDANGNLYVLDNGTAVSAIFNPSIYVFAPGATGAATPIRTISNIGNVAVSGNQACTSMVIDPSATHLFVGCGTIVVVFPIGANGAAASMISTSWEDDDVNEHNGLAFDGAGNLYVGDTVGNHIDIIAAPVRNSGAYDPAENGFNSLSPTTSWPSSVHPFGLLVDDNGTLYAPIFGGAAAELGIWSNVPCNNCVPTTTLSGPAFSSAEQASVALDPPGNVYLANPLTNQITEFSRATITAGSSANPTVLRTITNTSTGVTSGALGMTVGP